MMKKNLFKKTLTFLTAAMMTVNVCAPAMSVYAAEVGAEQNVVGAEEKAGVYKIVEADCKSGISSALTSDGSLFMWGNNYNGQLGNGTTENSSIPVKVMDNVKEIIQGSYYTAVITTENELYMWGGNYYGQLGNGTTTDSSVPVKVMDNVKSVDLGNSDTGVVTMDGTLYMWGNNYNGQLGNGTTENSSTPIKVMENVKEVELCGNQTAAITNDGSLYLWGCNDLGQLGNGTLLDSYVPIKVMENVVDFEASGTHCLAITSNNDLYLWGTRDGREGDVIKKEYEELGVSTFNKVFATESYTPVKVMENVRAIDVTDVFYGASTLSTLFGAITTNDELYLWGTNECGNMGNGNGYSWSSGNSSSGDGALIGSGVSAGFDYYNSETPVKIMENVDMLYLDGTYSQAVTKNGELYLWGGDMFTEDESFWDFGNVPTKMMDNVQKVVGANTYGSFGIFTTNGDYYMWGLNAYGQLGNGTTANSRQAVKLEIITPTRSFVSRLYSLVLNREGDEGGISSWVNALTSKESSGVDAGYGFVFSLECIERNLSNEAFVEMLYNTFMNRPSDEGGKTAWVTQLENGVEREKVLEGFIMSQEFAGICEEYGIAVGTIDSVAAFEEALGHYCNQNQDITAFVARCYTQALSREYDPVGLEGWCGVIINQENTPTEVAKNFIFSEEFIDKNLSDEEYVKVLYRTFFGREADEAGLAGWIAVLKSGEEDRAKVLDGFAGSGEFGELLASFGLD